MSKIDGRRPNWKTLLIAKIYSVIGLGLLTAKYFSNTFLLVSISVGEARLLACFAANHSIQVGTSLMLASFLYRMTLGTTLYKHLLALLWVASRDVRHLPVDLNRQGCTFCIRNVIYKVTIGMVPKVHNLMAMVVGKTTMDGTWKLKTLPCYCSTSQPCQATAKSVCHLPAVHMGRCTARLFSLSNKHALKKNPRTLHHNARCTFWLERCAANINALRVG